MSTKSYTPQETVEMAIGGIIKQGCGSYTTGTNTCRYRNPEGMKCVIGQLFPDTVYFDRIEGVPFTTLKRHYSTFAVTKYLQQNHPFLFQDRVGQNMQDMHDHVLRIKGMDAFVEAARSFCEGYSLDTSFLNTKPIKRKALGAIVNNWQIVKNLSKLIMCLMRSVLKVEQ